MLIQRASFRRLCRARDRLHQVDEPISIRAIAHEVDISEFHFTRQFRALFGVTPHQFRIRLRLDQAKQLLAGGRLSVTDVCMAVGFSSLGSFSDLFTRRVGVTPSSYQRRARAFGQVPAALSRELFPGCYCLMGRLPASAFRSFREA
ncbi:MAG TPA: AraC family transcriptional regulator [Polyangiaceae bacterium]